MRGAGRDMACEGKDDVAVIDTSQLSAPPNPSPRRSSQIGLGILGFCSVHCVFLSCFCLLKGEKSKGLSFPDCLGLESFLSACFIPSQDPAGHSSKGPHREIIFGSICPNIVKVHT